MAGDGFMLKMVSKLGWAGLVPILCVSTFGIWWSFLLLCYSVLFILGFSLVLGYIAYIKIQRKSGKNQSGNLGLPSRGLESVIQEMQQSRRSYKMDKRLTGSSIIDEPLQEVLMYFFRDYVHGWYYTISTDEEFLYNLRQTLQRALIAFSNRSKDVEWVNFLTRRFVDDITNHLKIYRKAKQRLDVLVKNSDGDDPPSADLEKFFFQVEHEMEEDICRDSICLSEEKEKEYLCDISEMLLYLLLPPEDFHNKPFRYFFRELIATCVLLPSVAMICDPDYINQTIAWLCKDSTFTREAFLTIIRVGVDSIEDVEGVKDKVELEIARLRSRDSEVSGAADAAVRQQLSSLLFVKRMCEAKIRRLKYGDGELPPLPTDQHELRKLLVPNQPLPTLLLQDILDNNTALSYFIEFMDGLNSQVYLYFWLTVEGYRVTAEQQLSVTVEQRLVREHRPASESADEPLAGHNDIDSIQTPAMSIYEQYLSDKADPRVILSKDLLKSTLKKISNKEPSPTCFDEAQTKVYEILSEERFYGAFLNSQCYIRCLLDLDILKEKSEDGDSSSAVDEDEVRSLADSELEVAEFQPEAVEAPVSQGLWSPDEEVRLNAGVTQIGLCKEGGKSHAVYSISVFRATSSGTSSWTVYRRYSDFDDLHLHIKEKFGTIPSLLLPGKRTFRNMEKEFLEKRREALDTYIQTMLSSELLGHHPGMFEIVASFLEHGGYTREKGQFARKVNTIVAPIRQVSHAIKTVPDGFNKMSGGIQKILTKPGTQHRDLKEESRNLYADIDGEEEDNIPLRILLLLMDEIFDLKDRNLWLRRRIVVILRQIIKTTYGDRINRKIVDTVEWATSAEQIADYVVMFRNSFWPGGVLAESAPERATDVKIRTRVTAKTKMFGSIPEELKRFLGTDVTIAGVCRVFDMFQYPSLNKRLIYVLSEGILELLFPDNKFPEIFRKIHAKAPKN